MLYNRCSASRSELLTDFGRIIIFYYFADPFAHLLISFLFGRPLANSENWMWKDVKMVSFCASRTIGLVDLNYGPSFKIRLPLFLTRTKDLRLNRNNLQLMVAKLCKRSQVTATSPAHLTTTETFDGAASQTERTFDMASFTFRSLTFLHFF